MHILHVIQDLTPATGTTEFLVELTRTLASEYGCRISLVTHKDYGIDIPGVDRIRDWNQLEGDSLPDVVHIHALWCPMLTKAHEWARKHGIPVVESTHGALSPWAMKSKLWKKLPYWWLYERRNLKSVAAFHVTAELEGEWVRKQGFLQQQHIVPLGIKMPAAAAKPVNNPKIILYVGRIYSVKGLDRIAAAIKLLKKRGAWDGWHMVMAGPDWMNYQPILERTLRTLGLTFSRINPLEVIDKVTNGITSLPDISLPGAVYGEAKARLFAAASIYVQASHTENFAQPVAEALSYEVPVVASRGTPWASVEDHQCGRWVDNSPEKLADALLGIISMTDSGRLEMGRRGRAWVEHEFSWLAISGKMLNAYQCVVNNSDTLFKCVK